MPLSAFEKNLVTALKAALPYVEQAQKEHEAQATGTLVLLQSTLKAAALKAQQPTRTAAPKPAPRCKKTPDMFKAILAASKLWPTVAAAHPCADTAAAFVRAKHPTTEETPKQQDGSAEPVFSPVKRSAEPIAAPFSLNYYNDKEQQTEGKTDAK